MSADTGAARNERQILELAKPIGLDEETLELLKLLPLVYVAWSDGEVQPEELSVIADSVEQLGIESEKSIDLLEEWLGRRPGRKFFQHGLKVLSYLVASLGDIDAEKAVADVTSLSESIAKAAGGLSGHATRIDADERVALRTVAKRLELGSRKASREALRGILDAIGKHDARDAARTADEA